MLALLLLNLLGVLIFHVLLRFTDIISIYKSFEKLFKKIMKKEDEVVQSNIENQPLSQPTFNEVCLEREPLINSSKP